MQTREEPIEKMIQDFLNTVEYFDSEALKLQAALQNVGIRGNEVAVAIGSCRFDVTSFALVFVETLKQGWASLHEVSCLPTLERLRRFARRLEGRVDERYDASDRGLACYKAMFYFVRAYQDAVARAFRLVYGQDWGKFTSMHDILKNKDQPPGSELVSKLPQYADWFYEFRNKRNEIKLGVSLAVGPDLSIIFVTEEVRNDGLRYIVDMRRIFRFEEMQLALIRSTEVTRFCKALAEDKGRGGFGFRSRSSSRSS